jgi:DNA-directed RNA polymerase specialized sigma24 family protein
MSEIISWIGAQAEGFEEVPAFPSIKGRREKKALRSRASMPELAPTGSAEGLQAQQLRSPQFPAEVKHEEGEGEASQSTGELSYTKLHELEVQHEEERWEEKQRAREYKRQEDLDREADLRRYRGRTVKLLRRYLRMAVEAGRLPSALGATFFRSGVTSYSAVTFEDRVIFVRDMEICLERLDEFSREVVKQSVLQEHSLPDAARILHCDEKTIRRQIPIALDNCSEILLNTGMLERQFSIWEQPCQEVKNDEFLASDCEQEK